MNRNQPGSASKYMTATTHGTATIHNGHHARPGSGCHHTHHRFGVALIERAKRRCSPKPEVGYGKSPLVARVRSGVGQRQTAGSAITLTVEGVERAVAVDVFS